MFHQTNTHDGKSGTNEYLNGFIDSFHDHGSYSRTYLGDMLVGKCNFFAVSNQKTKFPCLFFRYFKIARKTRIDQNKKSYIPELLGMPMRASVSVTEYPILTT